MIERIIEFSIRNRFLVLILAGALTIFAIYAVLHTPMDAIPDLSENQVIVFTDWMGRSPRDIEDQITTPLSLELQGLAGAKAVRSSSEFNFSMITIIFEDNVNFYFARERVLEKLALAPTFLPEGVRPYLAPDATALGQVFWYTVEPSPMHPAGPAELWALNKFYIARQLNSVRGVASVAPVGGMPKEYQVDVDPRALQAYGITLGDLYHAVSGSNAAFGGGAIQKNNAEYVVRGLGWIESPEDIENAIIKQVRGIPIYIKQVARVQVGPQFRRSVFEKDGTELPGGVVMMRHGENPLAVTDRIKQKIQELQTGLPKGVRIVPAYDRTRLIHGAIDTLTTVMWHEMIIAGLAVLLILLHVRSAFVICITLPLSVLFSFLLMWVLRQLRIVDVQANIMSLAGITISIGILVDQAIVMTENATHHLKERFGDRKVTGDTREIVVRACRTVGRPIFFSVMIILISFIPVFALSGREGKLFHPMAFTKSLAMVGVALISVTVVPALIPTFIKGRLRSEEENWFVRSLINIYKPVLEWALPRRNFVMWSFAALLILAAGMFPLQAVLGFGASERYWEIAFFAVLALVTVLTVAFTQGSRAQAVSFASLMLLGLIAYHFPKIGVVFMPALDEGTMLDMPVTVPRASVTQAADDLKHRDALLRSFPEVESVIGKAGRADTPTDPAPLDMIETFVNFRPHALWPKRVMKYNDAMLQTRAALRALEEHGYIVQASYAQDRDEMVNEAAMKALERFDEIMRELALLRYKEFEVELGAVLTRFVIEDLVHRFEAAGDLHWPQGVDRQREMDKLVERLAPEYGPWLSRSPALEDVTKVSQEAARGLAELRALNDPAGALALKEGVVRRSFHVVAEFLGAERKTLAREVLRAMEQQRMELWREQVKEINWELFDRGVEAFTWFALQELHKPASDKALVTGEEYAAFAEEAAKERLGKTEIDGQVLEPFVKLRQELEKPFASRLFLRQRQGGTKGDLIDDEMNRVLQVPGWVNIPTQPIINRIDMLSTGVRTQIGVKVFGRDLQTIDRVCKEIEQVLKPIDGARDVVAQPIVGKGYVQIKFDRKKAGRYGFSVQDVQETIEVALGGKVITQTIEGLERFPVRIRYARDFREDDEGIRRILVSHHDVSMPEMVATGEEPHAVMPEHAPSRNPPPQVPLGQMADVRIVEDASMIKSENGRLVNYVTLQVRGDRDVVGFVEEAQRAVAEKVRLPEGVHIEWSGEFEHQARAARTLLFVFPAVIVLIFIILYLTYQDMVDALLMLLAIPEALAGGVFFQFLFPKIMNGWDTPPMDFSMAVWIGYIACFGMATETGIIMLVYLREALEKRGGLENIQSLEELRQAVIEGAVHRLRPKLLTEGVAIIAIAPMLFATGVGAEVLRPMALPVLGGLLIADEVVDIFLPVRFYWVRRARWLKLQEQRKAAKKEQAVAVSEPQVLAPVPV